MNVLPPGERISQDAHTEYESLSDGRRCQEDGAKKGRGLDRAPQAREESVLGLIKK